MSEQDCGWYWYLHTDGTMLRKRMLEGWEQDMTESPFVKMYWIEADLMNIRDFVFMCLEACANGASPKQMINVIESRLSDIEKKMGEDER